MYIYFDPLLFVRSFDPEVSRLLTLMLAILIVCPVLTISGTLILSFSVSELYRVMLLGLVVLEVLYYSAVHLWFWTYIHCSLNCRVSL